MEIKAGQIWVSNFLCLKIEIVQVEENGLVAFRAKSTDLDELLSEGSVEKENVIKFVKEYKCELQEN